MPALHQQLLRRPPITMQNVDLSFRVQDDGDLTAVRREIPHILVVVVRTDVKSSHFVPAAFQGIDRCKDKLLKVRPVLRNQTQSCWCLSAAWPSVAGGS